MNLYDYFDKPETLIGYKHRFQYTASEAYNYAMDMNERFPEGEAALLDDRNPSYMTLYCINVLKRRWPEAERVLLERGLGYYILIYALEVMKQRWPEGEDIVRDRKYSIPFTVDRYELKFNCVI